MQSIHDKTLFLADYGEPFSVSHLGNRVKRYLNQAGIETPGACHLFRHAMATHPRQSEASKLSLEGD